MPTDSVKADERGEGKLPIDGFGNIAYESWQPRWGRDMTIQKIGIVANTAKEKALEYTIRLRDWVLKRGLEVYFHEDIATGIGVEGYNGSSLAARVDLLAVFGGDGTLLRTARSVHEHRVPIVGINLGEFGLSPQPRST
jgi:hypothetical protein